MKLKILITGGCGFIGKNISNYLINFKNYKIIVVDDLSSGNSNLLNNKIKIYKQKIDLIHLEKIIKKHRINHIIHCAAHFANQNSIENPYIDLKTNILGSLNVLNIAKKFKIKKLINLSSSCVYDNFRSNENSIKPSNKTPYAISKFAAEQYSSFFKNFYNMNIINLRLFNIYGPYDYYGKLPFMYIDVINCEKILGESKKDLVEEEKELGWKTKREVRVEVFKRALKAADDGVDKEFERLQAEATKRQLKIYFEALDEARKLGKDKTEAENYANNELTRAGIRRMDYLQKLIEEIKQKRLVERYMRLAGGGNG